ncbi:GumC family protein [Solirhodobacter olei]|uniref:GumC family protein n=1 Tax=Solirhodobacter olei TaxID=2493082 RepID=UPI000FDC4472|nr:hypothetical protein [Solirhodobacter olei]
MTDDQKYYLAFVFSRLHFIAAIFIFATIGSGIYAFSVKPQYDSSATLMLEAPNIRDSAAQANGNSPLEQLQFIEKRLLTRKNLLDIEKKLAILPPNSHMKPDDIVKAMERRTNITIDTGQDRIALLTIDFSAGDAQKAADGVNELVNRAIAYNNESRTSRARDTVRFFTQEVEQLKEQLNAQSAKIVAFQNSNTDALPATLDTRMQQQTSLQQRLPQLDGEIATLRAQKQQRIDIFRATGQVGTTATQTPEEKLLQQSQADLADALSVYAPNSEKITMLRGRIAHLKALIKAQPSTPSTTANPSSLIRLTSDLDVQIKQLELQKAAAQKELKTITDSINRTPQVEVQLSILNRDYANTENQYKAAKDSLSNASAAARIDALSKGERFVILDPAVVPDWPTKPNRKKIVLLGSSAGLILGLLFVVLQDMLNPSVRRPIELIRQLEITPLVAIPYTKTPWERLRQRLVLASLIVLLIVGLPALVFVSAAHYKPLATFLHSVGTKIGF